MKELKELKLEELSVKQKLGMTWVAHVRNFDFLPCPGDNMEFVLQMIRDHSLGAVWVDPGLKNREELMAQIKDAADYPILIITDAEDGFGEHLIGRHNALGRTGSPELAYTFGKVTGVSAYKAGYNVVCDPVLDMCDANCVCGGTMRSLGSDKYKVTEIGMAMAQGLKDAGVLTVGKHYPSAKGDPDIDNHMAENCSYATKEELADYWLYPYMEIYKAGLLDGIMTGHTRLPNIDPDYPTSLSKKVIGVIRELGFDGFAITDALIMGGAAAKFGERTCKGLAVANGNELALTWLDNEESFKAICETYDQGLIADDRLDEAVRRVLEAQHKTLSLPKVTEITDEDLANFDSINRDFTFAKCDEGLTPAIDRDGNHCFVVLIESESEVDSHGKVNVDTMNKGWYRPALIEKRLKELFPNSDVRFLRQFPTADETMFLLQETVPYDDVVYITFMQSAAYTGPERLTTRVTAGIQALQVTNRVSTVVHFGNPYVMEDLVHIPRIIIGGMSLDAVNYGLDVLAGKLEAKGVLTYDVKFK